MQIFPDPSDPTETKISKHKSEIEDMPSGIILQDQSRASLNKPLKTTVNMKSSVSTVSLHRSTPSSEWYLLIKR